MISISYRKEINKHLVKSNKNERYDIFGGVLECLNDEYNLKLQINSKRSNTKKNIIYHLENYKIIKNKNGKCLSYKEAIPLFMELLEKHNNINIENLRLPKQAYNNCWINTGIVIFFISDKGRQFNKYIREYMITNNVKGLKKKINKDLSFSLFFYNVLIEAYISGHILSHSINSTYIIEQFSRIKGFPNYNDKCGALTFQKNILELIHVDTTFLNNIYLNGKQVFSDIEKYNTFYVKFKLTKSLFKEDFLWIKVNSPIINKKTIITSNNNDTYVLDSIYMSDINFNHAICLVTIKGNEYLYDGSKKIMLKPFKWKNEDFLNSKINFTSSYLKYNMMKSYIVLCYYKI